MNEKFIEAVNSGNLIRVRIEIANEVMLASGDDNVREMVNFAEQKLSDLYDKHDGELLEEALSNFTEDAIAEIRTKLDYNFSKERLAYFEKVVKCVRSKKQVVNSEPEKKTIVDKNDNNILSTGLLIAGGVIIAGGIVAAKTIPIVIGTTLAAAGAVTVIKNNIQNK